MVSAVRFEQTVTTEEELAAIVGTPADLVVKKQLSALDRHCRAFIARSPFVLLGTAGADGTCDVSPRGDAPGFVELLDERTLLLPDRPGNRRVDGLRNIIANPHVGLLFIIPGMEETLRVNGHATIVRDPSLLERLTARDKTPLLAIAVEVEEAFLHCAKAFKRSALWQAETWPDRGELPSLAEMLMDQVKLNETSVQTLDRQIEDSYATRLY